MKRIKIQVFGDITLCQLVNNDNLKYCNAFIYRVKKFKKSLLTLSDPKYMIVLWSFHVSVTIYQSTWHSIPKNPDLQRQCRENLESYNEEEVQKGRFPPCMPSSHITRADVQQHSFSTLALRCRWKANFTPWLFSHRRKSFKHPIHSNYAVQNTQNIISECRSFSV